MTNRILIIVCYDNTDNNPIQIIISVSNLPNGLSPLKIESRQSLVRVYVEALVAKGPDHTMSKFNELKDDTTHYYINELEMNRPGFDLMKSTLANHQVLTLEVFKLNTLLYPQSGNTYDSYAIALEQVGHKEEALAMYRKSIALWPDHEGKKKAIKRLLDKKE